MRIGIDARYLSHGLVGGIHTHLSCLLPALLRAAPDHEFLLYADARAPFELAPLPAHARLRRLPWRSPLSSLTGDLAIGRWMAGDRVDLAHFPANYGFAPRGLPLVVTLHDAINLLPLREIVRGHGRHPRTVASMAYLHAATRLSLRRVDLLIAVSEYGRRAIHQQSGFPLERMRVVPQAPAPAFQRVSDAGRLADLRARYGLQRRVLLADAIKNGGTVVRAYRRLPAGLQQATDLVFFSRRPQVPALVAEAAAAGECRLLVRPPLDDLVLLYNLAEVFAFPSWVEGFGLPLLEAMACGAAVVASNRAAIPEVAGDAALLVEADDDAGLARALEPLLADEAARQELVARGARRVAGFTWERAAAATLAVYQEAAGLALAPTTPRAALSPPSGVSRGS